MPIPNPEPGLVISYAYLWHDEHRAGLEEGQKDRPSVIVLAVEREADGATLVTVLPITHTAPRDAATAVEIPMPIKRHLGLDDDPSWIIVAEGNEFLWPGHDLRKLPQSDRYDLRLPAAALLQSGARGLCGLVSNAPARHHSARLIGCNESNARCLLCAPLIKASIRSLRCSPKRSPCACIPRRR